MNKKQQKTFQFEMFKTCRAFFISGCVLCSPCFLFGSREVIKVATRTTRNTVKGPIVMPMAIAMKVSMWKVANMALVSIGTLMVVF